MLSVYCPIDLKFAREYLIIKRKKFHVQYFADKLVEKTYL